MTNKSDTVFSDKALLLLFLPIAGELALHYSVGIFDSMMVSSVGEAAVSGVSLMDFVISFFNSLLTALAVGGGVVVGQHIGNMQEKESSAAAMQTLLLLSVSGVVLCAAALLLQPLIVNSLFGDLAPEVRRHATVYFEIIAFSLPFLGIYSAAAAVFRAHGNTALPLRIMIAANILNVAGNAFTIYIMNMETRGVAIATLGARVFSAVVITVLLLKQTPRKEISAFIRPDIPAARRIIRLGIPYSFENGMFYLGRILVLIMVASFGTASIAANAVAQAIVLFQVLPGMAAVTGITVVVARCVGAEDFKKAEHYNNRIAGGIYLFHFASCMLILLPASHNAALQPFARSHTPHQTNSNAPRIFHNGCMARKLRSSRHVSRCGRHAIPHDSQRKLHAPLPRGLFLYSRHCARNGSRRSMARNVRRLDC